MLITRFRDQWDVELSSEPAVRQMLRQLAENAKIRLSNEEQTQVVLSAASGRPDRCVVTITRQDFEQATADITERMVAPARRAMSDVGLDQMDIDRVVLVGGMTRMPAVRRLAKEITGLEPYGHIDPDQVVALGAAIQAGVLAGQVRNVTLVDVTPLSLGIETQGGLFARVIERNTAIPVSRSRLFTNARNDQTAMEIHVLQGERELAADNMPLDTFELTGITPQPRGEAKVEVAFDIDANGMLHVSATDLQTDTSKRIRVESVSSPSREAVEQMLAHSQERMESDRHRREEIESAIKAENLLRAAEHLADQAANIPPCPEIRRATKSADAAAASVREALAHGQADGIIAASAALESVLKKLNDEINAVTTCVV